MLDVEAAVDDFIRMNQAGKVLGLCEKYYHQDVVMTSNGAIFAQSMQEAYKKQQGYTKAIKHFNVSLISKQIEGNHIELVFDYKMTDKDDLLMAFKGKHVQVWKGLKIVKEDYFSVK